MTGWLFQVALEEKENNHNNNHNHNNHNNNHKNRRVRTVQVGAITAVASINSEYSGIKVGIVIMIASVQLGFSLVGNALILHG